MTNTPPPCRDCELSPCTYITASRCERLREWQEQNESSPNTKIMVAVAGIKLVATSILLFVLLQLMYVGYHLISEKYDQEIVDMAQAAFYLGGMIGVAAMMVIMTARSIMDTAVDLGIRGLKLLKDHITGEKQKHSTQPRIKGGYLG